jgi:DNA-directed RNA polymerase specialized sigma24 family protein
MTVRNYGAPHQDPSALDEARLVDQAKSGNPEAFATLYDAHVERVSRYVYFRVTDDCGMEDLVSQVFLRAWEHLDRYKTGGSPFIAWLYTIARNLVIDHFRPKKKDLPLEEAASVLSDLEMPDDTAQTPDRAHGFHLRSGGMCGTGLCNRERYAVADGARVIPAGGLWPGRFEPLFLFYDRFAISFNRVYNPVHVCH